jgi:hypothetical protein
MGVEHRDQAKAVRLRLVLVLLDDPGWCATYTAMVQRLRNTLVGTRAKTL